MGYIVSGHGHRPNPAKTKAILAAPVATNTMELEFLGNVAVLQLVFAEPLVNTGTSSPTSVER